MALGGTLYQDIASQLPEAVEHDDHDQPRDYLAHEIEIEPQTYLAGIFMASRMDVNSRHHQAVKEVAPNLSVPAKAPDGIIEALEAPALAGAYLAMNIQGMLFFLAPLFIGRYSFSLSMTKSREVREQNQRPELAESQLEESYPRPLLTALHLL